MMVACGGLRGRGSDAYTLVFVGVVYESCHAAAFDYVHCDVFVGLCDRGVSYFAGKLARVDNLDVKLGLTVKS